MLGKERGDDILSKYERGKYASPHEWDKYVLDQFEIDNLAELDPYGIFASILTNAQGESTNVFPRKGSRYSWGEIYVTSECRGCPFFIEGDEQLKQLKRVWKYLHNVEPPENLVGVCVYAHSKKSNVIPKFLVDREIPTGAPGLCRITPKAREKHHTELTNKE
ncbi:hypothetical protein HYZ78_03370 [Candidatus Microgenomates bacterium]|nr:hypothetical protein [Candidatus Microgenomates bacterium]